MSNGGDGAHLGVGAERALETVLGGQPQPSKDERASRARLLETITEAASRNTPAGYDDAANMIAGLVFRFYCEKPEAQAWPVTQKGYYLLPDGTHADRWCADGTFTPTTPNLYDEVDKFTGGRLSQIEATGFMWGWAVNAARYVSNLPPEPNPAIIEISIPSERPESVTEST